MNPPITAGQQPFDNAFWKKAQAAAQKQYGADTKAGKALGSDRQQNLNNFFIFKAADINGDGVIDKDEKKKAGDNYSGPENIADASAQLQTAIGEDYRKGLGIDIEGQQLTLRAETAKNQLNDDNDNHDIQMQFGTTVQTVDRSTDGTGTKDAKKAKVTTGWSDDLMKKRQAVADKEFKEDGFTTIDRETLSKGENMAAALSIVSENYDIKDGDQALSKEQIQERLQDGTLVIGMQTAKDGTKNYRVRSVAADPAQGAPEDQDPKKMLDVSVKENVTQGGAGENPFMKMFSGMMGDGKDPMKMFGAMMMMGPLMQMFSGMGMMGGAQQQQQPEKLKWSWGNAFAGAAQGANPYARF